MDLQSFVIEFSTREKKNFKCEFIQKSEKIAKNNIYEKNAEFSKRQQWQQQSKSLYQQRGLFITHVRHRKLSIIFTGAICE